VRAPRLEALRRRIPPRAKHLHADVTHLARWRRLPVARPTRRFVKAHGLRVQRGPFAGMTYPRSAVGRAEQLVAKLLGAYELELHEPVARLANEPWEQIVDIGAGDGYYAVGLARACPGAVVRAWEMNPLPARVCLELARANGVEDRVVMGGECDLGELRALPELHTLVVSDCEGCEDTLLDPEAVPLLRRSTLVVELHESLAPGVEDRVVERFRPTHEVQTIGMRPRHAGEHPALAVDDLGYMDQELLVSEFRTNAVRWAVMTPTPTS
jgi:Met-10+ like-protein